MFFPRLSRALEHAAASDGPLSDELAKVLAQVEHMAPLFEYLADGMASMVGTAQQLERLLSKPD